MTRHEWGMLYIYTWMRIEVQSCHHCTKVCQGQTVHTMRECVVWQVIIKVFTFFIVWNCLSWVTEWQCHPGKHLSTMCHRNVTSHTVYLAHFPTKPQRCIHSLTSGKCVDRFGKYLFRLAILPLTSPTHTGVISLQLPLKAIRGPVVSCCLSEISVCATASTDTYFLFPSRQFLKKKTKKKNLEGSLKWWPDMTDNQGRALWQSTPPQPGIIILSDSWDQAKALLFLRECTANRFTWFT